MSNEMWSETLNDGVKDSSVQLLSAREVAKILLIGESTVNQLTRDGLLGYVKVTPSRKRFTEQLIREFIESQTVRGQPMMQWRWLSKS